VYNGFEGGPGILCDRRWVCTFLDATKAFDRVDYCIIFRELVKRNLPGIYVRLLVNYNIQTSLLMFLGMAFSVRIFRLRMVYGSVELLVQFYFVYVTVKV